MKFALAGNPNSGKTTLFNALTGSTAHVGNWPGVTVDRREGVYRARGADAEVQIVDLPGIYSLSPYTPEEIIARAYIIDESPDLIVNIVDSTNLERNLYLTTQLLESDIPVVVALNMTDVLNREGATIDIDALSERLRVPVVPISALKGERIDKLMTIARQTAEKPRVGYSPLESSPELSPAYEELVCLYKERGVSNPVFRTVKLIEGDGIYSAECPALAERARELRDCVKLDPVLDGDFEAAVADIRYRYIAANFKPLLQKARSEHEETTSDKIDRILTSRLFGVPIFLLVMYLVFHLTFAESLMFSGLLTDGGIPSPGVRLQEWMGVFTDWIAASAAAGLESAGASPWVQGLLIDGLVAGVGAVLSFLPQIMMLFLFLSIMEDSGYMARAALLVDHILRRFGLSGRAFLPLLMGFGCSVPAIMGTRTLAVDRERVMTIFLMPFFSCGAKLPIWSVFAAALFPGNADRVVFGIYIIGIVAAVLAAIALKKTILRGDASVLIMELPAYRMPQPRNLAIHLWEKARGFVMRATTIIAGATVIIWFLSNFDFSLSMVEPNSRQSIVGALGTLAAPLFAPLGFASGEGAWRPIVAIFTGLIAKEMVVSTLGVLYNPGLDADPLESDEAAGLLSTALVASFSPAAALSFMTYNLLTVPCMAAVATANAELRSGRWMWTAILFWLLTAWLGAFIVYHAALLLGL